jgi:DNA-binding YbaB/EbfC family protein
MVGVGKLLKQAQKMQRKMEQVQEKLAQQEIDVSCGGGAVQIKISGQGEFLGLSIDPEFLKEDVEFVEETMLEAVKEASQKAKEVSEEAMESVQAGMSFPGLM